jgi:Tfp pilus assembly protein PilO
VKRWLFVPSILVCVVLATVLTVWAVSLRSRLRQLHREAAELGEQARQSELLAGFLEQLRRQGDGMASSGLPLPEHRPLPPDRLPHLEEVFRGPADAAGVEVSQFSVDAESLSGDYRQLLVEVAVIGTQSSVRAYLLEICRVSCLLRLDSVSLKRLDESRLQMVVGLVLDLV